jgi:hypothetical protein
MRAWLHRNRLSLIGVMLGLFVGAVEPTVKYLFDSSGSYWAAVVPPAVGAATFAFVTISVVAWFNRRRVLRLDAIRVSMMYVSATAVLRASREDDLVLNMDEPSEGVVTKMIEVLERAAHDCGDTGMSVAHWGIEFKHVSNGLSADTDDEGPRIERDIDPVPLLQYEVANGRERRLQGCEQLARDAAELEAAAPGIESILKARRQVVNQLMVFRTWRDIADSHLAQYNVLTKEVEGEETVDAHHALLFHAPLLVTTFQFATEGRGELQALIEQAGEALFSIGQELLCLKNFLEAVAKFLGIFRDERSVTGLITLGH